MTFRVPGFALSLALGLLAAGCSTTGKGEKPFASVEIHGNTPGQVKAAAIEVFRGHGYTVTQSPRGRLICEKPASKLTDLAYGGWGGEAPLYMRVTVSVIPVAEETCRVECRAYRVEDRGGPTEKAVPLSAHSGVYQKLLEEIAARLRPGGASGS